MFALGYFAAGGLYGLAGICAIQSTYAYKTASQLEEGMNTPLPQEGKKAAYVALKCMGTPHFSEWFPTFEDVLVGRYFVVKSKPHIDVGIGVTNNEKQDVVVIATPRQKRKEYSVCLPPALSLTCGDQEVVVHHLDMAQWMGEHQKTKRTLHSPQNAAILLKEIGVQPDLTAQYQLKAEWFETDHITLFAQAIKVENRIYLQQPQNGYPFIATTDDPKEFVASLQARYTRLRKKAKEGAALATLIGSASRAHQIRQELPNPFNQWKNIRQIPQLKGLYACLAVCAVAGGTLLSTRF